MTIPVEAQSLSSLTTLFANPPAYSQNPTHEVLEALVLYIVRVPGSKDVFLTPLKPPSKASVSLEGVQSCLYYLHVVTPDDEAFRKSLGEQKQREEVFSRTPSIHRKPLPTAPFANYPPSERPPLPPKVYPHYQPPLSGSTSNTQVDRYVARGLHLRFNTSQEDVALKRQPVRPRPFHPGQGLADMGNVSRNASGSSPVGDPDVAFHGQDGRTKYLSTFSQDVASQFDLLQDKDIPPRSGGTAANAARREPHQSVRERCSHEISPQNDAHDTDLRLGKRTEITLIRRDPSSGSQWNIGTISFPATAHEGIENFSDKSVTVELTTPGYQKFVNGVDFGANSFKNAHEIKSLLNCEAVSSPVDATNSTPTSNIFTRQVQLQMRQEQGEGLHQRGTSDDVVTSLRQGFRNPPKMRMRPRFAFKSPWQGSCTFSTGIDGRSLRCRHTLSSISASDDELGADVAEVRFNLPWLALKTRDAIPRTGPVLNHRLFPAGHVSKESFKRGIRHLKNKSWNGGSSEMDSYMAQNSPSRLRTQSLAAKEDSASDSEDRMDLRLGQERAGGGFKGRSAKLGKLIIEDEGQKMCDLVVGACMGIWWQQYTARIEDP